MVKGIYNENEFYTLNYWDSKLKDKVKSNNKTLNNLDAKIKSLKSCANLYWDLKGCERSSSNYIAVFHAFIDQVATSLGYNFEFEDFVTQENNHITSVLKISSNDPTKSALGFMIEEHDEGSFEQPAYYEPKQDAEATNDERDLIAILNEELLDELVAKWIYVFAPNALFLVDKSKWPFGRYLKFEWDEIFSQSDNEVYSMVIGLLSKETIIPKEGGSLHDSLNEESHRHAFAVTTELREGVRISIELLVNEILYQKRKSKEKYLSDNADLYAKELTHDALFFVYRLIFLLFLEAQGEDSDLLPLKSAIYRNGYSLDKLLETVFIDLQEGTTDYEGYFLSASLEKIFDLIYFGFSSEKTDDLFDNDQVSFGFFVQGLKSDLFDPTKLNHLGSVKLRNGVLRDILEHLSLSKPKDRKSKRGRVSYSNLGINQLGAVYEGLLSYTGFFASEDLYALKSIKVKQTDLDRGKDLDKVYLAPKSLVDTYSNSKMTKKFRLIMPKVIRSRGDSAKYEEGHFVLDDSGNPKVYKKGSFVYRIAGRDRKMSASYYTPEVLTECTTKFALKTTLEKATTTDDLYSLKLLEPAMGSGAFLNEAVNQIAQKILEIEWKAKSNSKNLNPKEKSKRLSEIKFRLTSNNVYGIDLNETAVELARFSLWLNCIYAGKGPPDLSGKLKVGNSLIGARFKKESDGVYHWLKPHRLWGQVGKKLKEYNPETFEALKEFSKQYSKQPTEAEISSLRSLQLTAEGLYKDLGTSKEIAIRDAIGKAMDLWVAGFFLNKSELKHFPTDLVEYIQLVSDILKMRPISDEVASLLKRVRKEIKPLHWELEFSNELRSGGFDLILGNPPWVSVGWEDAIYASDLNVIPAVCDLNAADSRKFANEKLNQNEKEILGGYFLAVDGFVRFLDTEFYSILAGVSKNTYKAFDVLCLDLLSKEGSFALIHEDGIWEDKKATALRKSLYPLLRYHFQFINEKYLFSDVNHTQRFSVNIFSKDRESKVSAKHIGNLFLVNTIYECFDEANSGPDIPLVRDEDDNWETNGHTERVVVIDADTIKLFGEFINDTSDAPILLNLHSNPLRNYVERLAKANQTILDYLGPDSCVGSQMLNETSDQDSGIIHQESLVPENIEQVILSGPHIFSACPFYQQCEVEFRDKSSYSAIDLESISADFLPRTIYQFTDDKQDIDAEFPKLNGLPYRSFYRIVTRGMVNPSRVRSLFTAIIPPGVCHINGLRSLAISDSRKVLVAGGLLSSIIYDGILRLKNKTNFFAEDFKSFPIGEQTFFDSISRRALALNGITSHYDQLWQLSSELKDTDDHLSNGRLLTGFGGTFRHENVLRSNKDRATAMIEIDAMAALSFGMSLSELIQVYEILFPVQLKYDRKDQFDRKQIMKTSYEFFESRGW